MMSSIVSPYIFDVKPYIPGKPIEELKRELGLKKVIKLASNECPFPPSSKVLKTIANASVSLNRYPDGGCFQLRHQLAKHLKINPDQLIFGNGSDEVIVMAVKVFVKPLDEVIVAKPSFLVYEIASQVAGAKIKQVPLVNFAYDLVGMKKLLGKRTRLIFIGNPDNPSSTYIPKEQLVNFLEDVPATTIVVLDEAYFEFVTNSDYPDGVQLLKRFSNLLVTRTFSKMYGLAGLRVGYGIASSEMIRWLERVREPFNVNSLAQVAASACLKDAAYYKNIAKIIQKQKEYLYQQLTKLSLDFVLSSTNFILINVKQDSQALYTRLLKKGVIVRDMNFWGLKNFIRVSIGTESENRIFIKTLREVL